MIQSAASVHDEPRLGPGDGLKLLPQLMQWLE